MRPSDPSIKFEAVGVHAAPRECAPTRCVWTLAAVLCGVALCSLRQHVKDLIGSGPDPQIGQPQRLRVVGQDIFVPGGSRPILFRGFDLMFKHGTAGMDRVMWQDRLLSQLVPGVNLVRLIVNHWFDDVTTAVGSDCYDEMADGFLRPACLTMFDDVIRWATTELGSWVIITARSALAAGDAEAGRTIFDNATLRTQWCSMWTTLARRYASVDRIAGFEVMSEPRTFAAAQIVHEAQQLACNAVWSGDANALCVVGAARFYDRFQLNESYLINGGPTLYAANFFAPRSWVSTKINQAMPNASYPGDFPCCDVYQKDRERRHKTCGGDDSSACTRAPLVRVDRCWLEDQLRNALHFRDAHNVPIWIDQWGVRADAVGGADAQGTFLSDVLDVFQRERLHWTYWMYVQIC